MTRQARIIRKNEVFQKEIEAKLKKKNKIPTRSLKRYASFSDDMFQMTIIYIDCMDGCGNKIRKTVAVDDIVPSLGRPRGLRVRCHVCASGKTATGMVCNGCVVP